MWQITVVWRWLWIFVRFIRWFITAVKIRSLRLWRCIVFIYIIRFIMILWLWRLIIRIVLWWLFIAIIGYRRINFRITVRFIRIVVRRFILILIWIIRSTAGCCMTAVTCLWFYFFFRLVLFRLCRFYRFNCFRRNNYFTLIVRFILIFMYRSNRRLFRFGYSIIFLPVAYL